MAYERTLREEIEYKQRIGRRIYVPPEPTSVIITGRKPGVYRVVNVERTELTRIANELRLQGFIVSYREHESYQRTRYGR